MKKVLLIFMCCLFFGLLACGNTDDPDQTLQQRISIEQEEGSEYEKSKLRDDIEDFSEDVNIPDGSVVASDYVQSITSVIAYSEGKYVVQGVNKNKTNFCGILYSN